MDIVDYDIINIDDDNALEILVFLKIVETINENSKLSYKSLNNMIYRISDGFCITNRKGVPLVIRKDLEMCEQYLNEEYMKTHNVMKELVLTTNVT